MKLIGLTGSIGMGKSTVGKMFIERGIPLFDADAAVHELYRQELVEAVEEAFPGTTGADGVDRVKLSAALNDDGAMKKLEAIVHPAVGKKRKKFLQEAKDNGASAVILDVPLLFETGGENRVDVSVLVSAPAEAQRERVLQRPGMSVEKFEAILARQMPDEEKRRRADFIIDTGVSLEETASAVDALINEIVPAK